MFVFPVTSFVFFSFLVVFLLYLTPLHVVRRLCAIPCTVDATSLPQGHRIPPCTNRLSPHYSTVLLLRCILISCHPLVGLSWPLFCMHFLPTCPPSCCGCPPRVQTTASHCALFSSHSLWLTYSPILLQTQALLQLNATGETVIYCFLFTLFGNNECLWT